MSRGPCSWLLLVGVRDSKKGKFGNRHARWLVVGLMMKSVLSPPNLGGGVREACRSQDPQLALRWLWS